MKWITILSTIFLLWTFNPAYADGIEFFNGTFEEAKQAAKEQSKLIFVDAYAVWCGPCKRMASSVFPQKEVGDAFNPNYISLKLDMEKGDGLTFRQQYPVKAFPTLFFMDENGDILEVVVGAKSAPDLINLAQKHASGRVPGKNFAEAYEKGDRSPETILNYITALNASNKSSLAVTNDFLREWSDFSDETALQIIFEGTVESDSKVFDYFIEHRKAIEGIYAKEEVEDRILDACLTTVVKAADYDYEALKDKAKAVVKQHVSHESKSFNARADILFYARLQDKNSFLSSSKDYVKLFKKDEERLYESALLALRYFKDEEAVLEKAEEWAKMASKDSDDHEKWYTYAVIAEKNNNIDAALIAVKTAKEKAESAEKSTWQIDRLINNLELRK